MTAAIALAALAGVVLLTMSVQHAAQSLRRARGDAAAHRMGKGRDLAAHRQRGARATARRLGVTSPGLTIARTVAGNRPLYQGWEDCSLDVAGPRVGKTTCRVVPAILEAPGAVLATSNKRDLVDATRPARAAAGAVWVFDPQRLIGEPAGWWWNPLSYVTDETKAADLADVFAAAHAEPQARSDAFFAPKGQKVVAALLLAAAAAGRTLDQVYTWVTDPDEDEPVTLLRRHGYALLADGLKAEINAPPKQRGGVYGSAERSVAFLTNRETLPWITPAPDRREFDPHAFVRGTATLYSLSKEGRGSAGALVAGLTVAVTDAAEEHAKRSPGGRLPLPLVAVLDEACNVCRWPELPNLYSHYGSRGICLMTFAQSWSQLAEAFGRDGARKLWSAATVKVVGGGVAEADFLEDLSRLIGDFDEPLVSVGQARGGRSTNRTTRRRRVLDVAELAALPKGRAVVLCAGAPPTLARTLPYWERS